MLLLTNCEVHTESIWTAVLMYGPNEVAIRALLYSHNQRPKPSLDSELNIFVLSLNAAVGIESRSRFSTSERGLW